LRKWLALSGAERRVVIEAILLIAAFGLALKLLPFRAVVRRIRSRARSGSPVSSQRIGVLVDAAGRILHASCLPRAFALARMLASRGMSHDLRVGVRRTGWGIAAHAWVSDDSGVLLGGAGTGEYAPLLVYSTAR
jgi:Transglutaminase-like superfamily